MGNGMPTLDAAFLQFATTFTAATHTQGEALGIPAALIVGASQCGKTRPGIPQGKATGPESLYP
ncbi:MAG: hypothetical protein LBU25_04305 [Treponema sp.]|nr:hypothetical protein [Treponema sp.]